MTGGRVISDTSSKGCPTLRFVKRAVIFDGDDTLWLTERLYDEARARTRTIVCSAGFDGARWEELERTIDVRNVAVMGHSPSRFPASCVEALEALEAETGTRPSKSLSIQVRTAAESVFTASAPLRPHAKKVLRELSSRGLKLALLTKGDHEIQGRRIAHSGLRSFFDVISIVDDKTADSFRDVLSSLGTDAAGALSVGNSVRSDVLASISAGVDAVWIPSHVWEYERAHDHLLPEGVARIAELDDLLELVDSCPAS